MLARRGALPRRLPRRVQPFLPPQGLLQSLRSDPDPRCQSVCWPALAESPNCPNEWIRLYPGSRNGFANQPGHEPTRRFPSRQKSALGSRSSVLNSSRRESIPPHSQQYRHNSIWDSTEIQGWRRRHQRSRRWLARPVCERLSRLEAFRDEHGHPTHRGLVRLLPSRQ